MSNYSFKEEYIGKELELFQNATNWKQYWFGIIKPYISGHVLEIGCGIGTNSFMFLENCQRGNSLTCIDPDENMLKICAEAIGSQNAVIKKGTIKDADSEGYDTIIYIDVLEHIENDYDEITIASNKLKDGGHLIILAPAFSFLFSEFDKSIGHYRRYDKKKLNNVIGGRLKTEKLFYLDSIGLFASIANKFLLKQSLPNEKQIHFWDNFLVPSSRVCDKLVFFKTGKSILGIWEKR